MKVRGFELHPNAIQDIAEIWECIAADSVVAASRLREEILEAIRELTTFPNQGHQRPELTSKRVRFHVVREYLVAYAPEEDPIVVLAIVHGRRNPRVIAAMLRKRE